MSETMCNFSTRVKVLDMASGLRAPENGQGGLGGGLQKAANVRSLDNLLRESEIPVIEETNSIISTTSLLRRLVENDVYELLNMGVWQDIRKQARPRLL